MASEKSEFDAFKKRLAAQGRGPKVVLSDKEFRPLFEAGASQRGSVACTDAELRYMEGMFDLPLGYIAEFRAVPASDSKKCVCGRTPNAFDIVMTAARKKIHDRQTIRDTLIGYQNIFEVSKGGRTGECVNCGRSVTMSSYWTHAYMYA